MMRSRHCQTSARREHVSRKAPGHPTLHTNDGHLRLAPGMCAGFKAGTGDAHRLVNDTQSEVIYLEVGDRTPGDEAAYPDDDIQAALVDGKWRFVHKDGAPYD